MKTDSIAIHTTVSKEERRKLLEYGKGSLHEGIINLLKISESKTIEVMVITNVELGSI